MRVSWVLVAGRRGLGAAHSAVPWGRLCPSVWHEMCGQNPSPAETGAGMDGPVLLWDDCPCCLHPLPAPARAASPVLSISPHFAKSSGIKDAAGRSCRAALYARERCLWCVAGAPGSAMLLTVLWFITNANTLSLFSTNHPQGSQSMLHLLTSCYMRYLYPSPQRRWERGSLGSLARQLSPPMAPALVGCSDGAAGGHPLVLKHSGSNLAGVCVTAN